MKIEGKSIALRRCFWVVSWLLTGVVLSSCFGVSPPSRFFTLVGTELPARCGINSGTSVIRVGVGPVTIASYLDRSGVVSIKSPYEFSVSDFDIWAEPLASSIARAVSTKISHKSAVPCIESSPNDNLMSYDYSVTVTITRLDTDASGAGVLTGIWQLKHSTNLKRSTPPRSFSFQLPSRGTDTQERVSVMAELLEKLAEEVRGSIL